MAKKPVPDGYTRNPKYMGWVYPKPDGYGPGMGLVLKIFAGMEQVWDWVIYPFTQSDYPKNIYMFTR